MLELFALLKKKITSSSRCTSGPENLSELSIFRKRYYKPTMFAGICMFVAGINCMQIKVKIPFLFVAVLAWIVIISSCANQGMPTGGPKDSLPPVLIETSPAFRALNFDGDKVKFTFDEYVISDAISEMLVVSPPLEKKPTIRTKGKSLIIQFNEELKDSTTYSLDFKNSIADNNERNEYKNMRFSFSTGPVYDSLRVAGRLMNAFNLEAVDKGLIVLQKNLHDSAVFRVRPDYIAKTDEKGFFMIDNIAPGTYNIFAINDANNNLLYDEGAEEFAFIDSVIVPSAKFFAEPDTVVDGADSLLISGHTQFYPGPIFLHQFTEDIFDQYLDDYKRKTRYKCEFYFSESVADTFNVRLIGFDTNNWYQLEYNDKKDSMSLWITDTTIARNDSLLMELSYFQLDSMAELYVQKDTLEMVFIKKEKTKTKKKKRSKETKEDKPKPIEQFSWISNAGSSVFELNNDIYLTAPEPVSFFDSTQVVLYLTDDTLKTPLKIEFSKDTSTWRRYIIKHNWEPETGYTLEIDSAACTNIYGITSRRFVKKFVTREEDYYGSVIVNATNVYCPMLVQLLKNDDDETVLFEHTIEKDGAVVFDYLVPGKYKAKVIYDENGNGKWDTGSYQDKYQPEEVGYENEVIKVRSNWDKELLWNMKPDNSFIKNIRDLELEEQKRKAAEKKAREEKENPKRPANNLNNMMQGGGNIRGTDIIR